MLYQLTCGLLSGAALLTHICFLTLSCFFFILMSCCWQRAPGRITENCWKNQTFLFKLFMTSKTLTWRLLFKTPWENQNYVLLKSISFTLNKVFIYMEFHFNWKGKCHIPCCDLNWLFQLLLLYLHFCSSVREMEPFISRGEMSFRVNGEGQCC